MNVRTIHSGNGNKYAVVYNPRADYAIKMIGNETEAQAFARAADEAAEKAAEYQKRADALRAAAELSSAKIAA